MARARGTGRADVSVLVGLLVAVAALALVGPRPRRWSAAGGGGSAGTGVVRSRTGRRTTGSARRERADLADVLLAVAAQVRAGAPPPVAWARALGEEQRVVEPQELEAALRRATGCGAGRRHAALRARVRGAVAGAGVAADTGAPLADVLEDLATAVEADAEQAGDLEAALAGPRATARVLSALPLLGVLVGAAMGARPWAVLTTGGVGTALGVAGAVLLVAGRLWVGALLRRAAVP